MYTKFLGISFLQYYHLDNTFVYFHKYKLNSNQPVSPTAVQALDHGELFRYPCPMFKTFDMADVPTQRPMDAGAVGADEDASVDTCPTWVTGSTVSTNRQRVSGFACLTEHIAFLSPTLIITLKTETMHNHELSF